ncbi:putative ATP-grasp-modified RiPP [Streptomyces sp. RKAG337]|uniref:putative ATP-grasp-modified RiPP n=1 Tax=Streptomyces sp. RKAG337 TaxID=2893404 RepID=UPI0020346666|nr:putative ATP-grasp-modified RiPP [Streptomyces sp. RKAG337]MCM2426817.1 putative ATP-grasp-modified RiPP [Streptomyces sp. RKAG337]
MPERASMPWGLTRMAPFPGDTPAPAPRIVLDAGTQRARWLDTDGVEISAWSQHKKSETSKETSTKTSLDGTPDQGSDQSGDSD